MERNVVYFKDLNNQDIDSILVRIMESNEVLYDLLTSCFESSPKVGIDRSVLEFISDSASAFPTDQGFLLHLIELTFNSKSKPEHFKFIAEYLNDFSFDNRLPADDFFALLDVCIDKSLPISEIKTLFYSNDDSSRIFESINGYLAISDEVSSGDSSIDSNTSMADSSVSVRSVSNIDTKQSSVVRTVGEHIKTDVEMMNIYISALSQQDEDIMDVINDVQHTFTSFIGRLQSIPTDLSAFSNDISAHLKKYDTYIHNLHMSITFYKNLVSSKQRTINELRSENERLNEIIKNYQLSNMEDSIINEKTDELLNLLSKRGKSPVAS